MCIMPTARVYAVEIQGRQWFRKVNPDPRLNDIEFRIYQALRRSFDYTLKVIQESSTTLLVQGAGTTFADIMNSPACERLATLDVLYSSVRTRSAVNSVVNQVLTDADKAYLTRMQREKLLQAVQKRNHGVDGDEIVHHYWAYRMMHALGIEEPAIAWGMGIDRLAMFKLGIKDIRYLFSDDLDWLRESRMVRE